MVCKVNWWGKRTRPSGKVTHCIHRAVAPMRMTSESSRRKMATNWGEKRAQRLLDQRPTAATLKKKKASRAGHAACPVIETAHRLVALTEAHQRRTGEHRDAETMLMAATATSPPPNSRPATLRGEWWPRWPGPAAQKEGRPPEDLGVPLHRGPERPEGEGKIAVERAAHQQAEAEELAEDGGQGGAAGVHIQDKDEDGVQDDVDHGAPEKMPTMPKMAFP